MTLIEELREETIGLCHSNDYHPLAQYDNGYLDGLEIAIEIVEHHSDWIPASEPPKENGEYLVTMKGLNERDRFTTINYFYEGEWENFEEKVLAWQPLPKPYEGERK